MPWAKPTGVHDEGGRSGTTHSSLAVDENSAPAGAQILSERDDLPHILFGGAEFRNDVRDEEAPLAGNIVIADGQLVCRIADG
jgi:hypothetical protein